QREERTLIDMGHRFTEGAPTAPPLPRCTPRLIPRPRRRAGRGYAISTPNAFNRRTLKTAQTKSHPAARLRHAAEREARKAARLPAPQSRVTLLDYTAVQK